GWWVQGDGEWGQFKPDRPRRDCQKDKLVKYESPQRMEATAYRLRIPLYIWRRIASRYNLTVPSLNSEEFWDWVEQHPEIPIIITEGAKKAGAMLTQSYAAIALPGIWMGQRTPKDKLGNKNGNPYLIPTLKRYAVKGRVFYLAFDSDSKPTTIASVNKASSELGWLLRAEGCEVKVMSWSPELGKGIDDVIVSQGDGTLQELYNQAITLDNWLARSYTQLTYPAQVELNQRYLGKLTIPDTCKLIGIQAPKGTGKTESLIDIVADARASGQPVLVLTHRTQLGQDLCKRFGLPYVTELKESSSPMSQTLGYGLCMDSLHAKSMAKFDPNCWRDALIIVDEVEQVLWHTLNSQTCQRERVVILKNLKTLIRNAFTGKGRVILSDADLSDVSVDYIKALGGLDIEPYIIRNNWKPGSEHQWRIHLYTGNNPSALVARAESLLTDGGKLFISCDAQQVKAKYGTQNLEAHFRRLLPHLKILRIDSETVSDPQHPAYGCIGKLNDILPQYDLVIASPSIETGVSIDIKDHFTAVFGIAQGVLAVASVCQFLARVRANIPRYLWAAKSGRCRIAGGSTSHRELLLAQEKLTQANINLLVAADMHEFSSELFQPESLTCWAKMAVRINVGMKNYRQSIVEALIREGHVIAAEDDEIDPETKTQVESSRALAYQVQREAIASAQDLTETEYKALKDQRAKTKGQWHQERKYELKKRYGLEVTPELVEQDDEKWYPQLRLHYYLTLGREHLSARDKKVALSHLEAGSGDVWAPNFNESLLGLKIFALLKLGIADLLSGDGELTNSSPQLVTLAQLAKSQPWQIKQILGITVRQDNTPIAIAQRVFKIFGAKLTCVRREGTDGNRVRVYKVSIPDDQREAVFAHWLERDTAQNVSDYTSTENNKSITSLTVDVEPHQWTLGQRVKVQSNSLPTLNGLVGWIRELGKELWIEFETGIRHYLPSADVVPV
ncbi:MAG TPA: plasmid replication protein, CyRepA1 family, partial [Coleofasciculaceae cyanobacterium]